MVGPKTLKSAKIFPLEKFRLYGRGLYCINITSGAYLLEYDILLSGDSNAY